MDNFHLMEQIKLFATVNKIDFNLILYFDTNRSIMPVITLGPGKFVKKDKHRALNKCRE